MRIISMILCCYTIFFMTQTARAAGFATQATYEWSARNLALGGASMSGKPDPSAVVVNPAAITRLSGLQLQIGAAAVRSETAVNIQGIGNYPTTTDRYPSNMYLTMQVTDRLSMGMGVYSRFGMKREYDAEWAGRYDTQSFQLRTTSVAAVAAIKITDRLSAGFGLEGMYAKAKQTRAIDGTLGIAPVMFDISSSSEGDDFGIGYNASLHYKANEKWAFSALYRSDIRQKLSGPVQLVDVPTGGDAFARRGENESTIRLPESISLSLAHSPLESLSLELIAMWTRWDRYGIYNFHTDIPGFTRTATRLSYKNTWRIGFGMEYSLCDWLDLRFGYAWEQTPINDLYASYIAPNGNSHTLSVGAGLTFGKCTVDLAYALTRANARYLTSRQTDHPAESKSSTGKTHMILASVSFKF